MHKGTECLPGEHEISCCFSGLLGKLLNPLSTSVSSWDNEWHCQFPGSGGRFLSGPENSVWHTHSALVLRSLDLFLSSLLASVPCRLFPGSAWCDQQESLESRGRKIESTCPFCPPWVASTTPAGSPGLQPLHKPTIMWLLSSGPGPWFCHLLPKRGLAIATHCPMLAFQLFHPPCHQFYQILCF
jgi:hypothetical protein